MMLWRGWQHLGAYAGERRPGTKSPASVFSVQGGEIVVAEKFLAAKLGPSRRRSRRKCVGVSSIAWPSGAATRMRGDERHLTLSGAPGPWW